MSGVVVVESERKGANPGGSGLSGVVVLEVRGKVAGGAVDGVGREEEAAMASDRQRRWGALSQ